MLRNQTRFPDKKSHRFCLDIPFIRIWLHFKFFVLKFIYCTVYCPHIFFTRNGASLCLPIATSWACSAMFIDVDLRKELYGFFGFGSEERISDSFCLIIRACQNWFHGKSFLFIFTSYSDAPNLLNWDIPLHYCKCTVYIDVSIS